MNNNKNIYMDIPHGFRWSVSDRNFDDRYTPPNTRKNQHIVFFKGKWCVHAEGDTTVRVFESRDSAIAFARKEASLQKTEALLYKKDNTIQTAWVYSSTAYPQEKMYPPKAYPIESHPGETVL